MVIAAPAEELGLAIPAVKFNWEFPFKQVGFGVAVREVIAGTGFTTTTVLDGTLGQPAAVAVNTYVPAAASVVPAILGFWLLLANPFGPVQLNVVPISVVPVRFKGWPMQTGLLLPAVAVGNGFTVKVNSFELSETGPVEHVFVITK